MLEHHIEFLRCPSCNNSLRLKIFEKFSNQIRIKSGILFCSCGLWYPIINGVPRMLTGKLRNLIRLYHVDFINNFCKDLPKLEGNERDLLQERTAFTHDQIKPLPPNFKKFDNLYKVWIEPLEPDFYKDKIVLDAGCRLGNHTYYAAKWGSKLVIGIDIGQTVEYAFEANREMDNVLIIQADIHKIPTQKIFDFIFSIGVLHHLPNPNKGFKKLVEKIKPKSTMLIHVYRYENYQDLNLILFLRKFTTRSIHLCKLVSLIHSSILFVRIKFYKYKLKIKNKKSKNRFDYLIDRKFSNIKNYIFNQLFPPIAFYYSKEELEKWFQIKEIKEYEIFNQWQFSLWKAIITFR